VHFDEFVSTIGRGVEAVGIMVIVLGGVVASVRFFSTMRGAARVTDGYTAYRRDLGRALLLGLEFLVAGDIIRTVAASPNLNDVAVLAGIVLIRTFLSFTLELETEGRWPWQRTEAQGHRDDTSGRRAPGESSPGG
jgi:uncharacterized membrane protein